MLLDDTIALHGFSLRVPAAWELAVNTGESSRGVLVLAEERTPRLALSWERSRRKPDWDRSLTALTGRMQREHAASVVSVEPISGGGRFVRFRAADGERHAALVQPDPEQSLLLVLRQLAPGGADALRELVRTLRVHDAEPLLPWRFHGLACALPPAWKLVGVHNLVGLQRAVWFRTPRAGRRADAVLVLRRYACASQQLHDGSIADWVRGRLAPGEVLQDAHENAAGFAGISDAPGSTWWRRFRGQRERRHLHAWREAELDRLILQEWKGAGEPLPALRGDSATKTAPSLAASGPSGPGNRSA